MTLDELNEILLTYDDGEEDLRLELDPMSQLSSWDCEVCHWIEWSGDSVEHKHEYD